MLGLLMVGVLMRPAMAIACEMHDVLPTVGADAGAHAAAAEDSDEDCCSFPGCHESCAHTAALIPQFEIPMPVAVVVAPSQPLPVAFDLPEQPVALRPPILS